MEFLLPNPDLLRRSKCGRYLIEKEIGEDGKVRYCLWVFVKSIYGFNSAQEAVDEARSLEAEAVAAWKAHQASVAPLASAGATPAPDSLPAAPASE